MTMKLDEKGRCCGHVPIHYKSTRNNISGYYPMPSKFCPRCARSFDPETGKQIENWKWKKVGVDWVRKKPRAEIVSGVRGGE